MTNPEETAMPSSNYEELRSQIDELGESIDCELDIPTILSHTEPLNHALLMASLPNLIQMGFILRVVKLPLDEYWEITTVHDMPTLRDEKEFVAFCSGAAEMLLHAINFRKAKNKAESNPTEPPQNPPTDRPDQDREGQPQPPLA